MSGPDSLFVRAAPYGGEAGAGYEAAKASYATVTTAPGFGAAVIANDADGNAQILTKHEHVRPGLAWQVTQ
jgi:hypothetical protein